MTTLSCWEQVTDSLECTVNCAVPNPYIKKAMALSYTKRIHGTQTDSVQRQCSNCGSLFPATVTCTVDASAKSGVLDRDLERRAYAELAEKELKNSFEQRLWLESPEGRRTSGILCPFCETFTPDCLNAYHPHNERGLFSEVTTKPYTFSMGSWLVIIITLIAAGIVATYMVINNLRGWPFWVSLLVSIFALFFVNSDIEERRSVRNNKELYLKLSDEQVHQALVAWCMAAGNKIGSRDELVNEAKKVLGKNV